MLNQRDDMLRPLFLLILVACVVSAQPSGPWSIHQSEGTSLRNQGRYREALRSYQKALALVDASDPAAAMIRNDIGMAWLGLRDFHQAERQLRLALNQLEAVAPGRPDSAKVLLNLVTALRNRKHFGQAEEASTRATAILESAFGENHPIVALALNSRAEILLQTSRCQESAALLERALITWESAYGREDPFTATLLNNLGTARACLGDDASAERWLALALQVRERVLPPGHPYIALTLSNYAHVLGKLGRNKESGQFRKRADGLRVEHDSSNLIGRAIALRDWTSLRRGW